MTPSLVPYSDSDDDNDDEARTLKQGKSNQRITKRRKLEAFNSDDNVDETSKKGKVHTSLGIAASNPIKGDWVCHCFIPMTSQTDVLIVMNQAYDLLLSRNDQVKVISDPHISLTKPILIRFHEKNSLLVKAKEGLAEFVKVSTSSKRRERISLAFSAFTHLPSEDGSRIYWAIEIGLGWQELRSLASSLSSKLACFHAREYYKEARFHCSFAWSPSRGSTDRQLSTICNLLESTFGRQLRACLALFIDKIGIATGSQIHYVNLNNIY